MNNLYNLPMQGCFFEADSQSAARIDASFDSARRMAENAGKDAACIFRCKVQKGFELAVDCAMKIMCSQCPETQLEIAAGVFNLYVGDEARAFVKEYPGGIKRLWIGPVDTGT
jgi:hypothetical protein